MGLQLGDVMSIRRNTPPARLPKNTVLTGLRILRDVMSIRRNTPSDLSLNTTTFLSSLLQ